MILKAWGCLLFTPPPIVSHVAFSVLLFVTQTQVCTNIQFFLLPLLHRTRLLLHASSCLCHFMFPGELFTLVFRVLWSWPLGGPYLPSKVSVVKGRLFCGHRHGRQPCSVIDLKAAHFMC